MVLTSKEFTSKMPHSFWRKSSLNVQRFDCDPSFSQSPSTLCRGWMTCSICSRQMAVFRRIEQCDSMLSNSSTLESHSCGVFSIFDFSICWSRNISRNGVTTSKWSIKNTLGKLHFSKKSHSNRSCCVQFQQSGAILHFLEEKFDGQSFDFGLYVTLELTCTSYSTPCSNSSSSSSSPNMVR